MAVQNKGLEGDSEDDENQMAFLRFDPGMTPVRLVGLVSS